jgi:hypothetical protein
MPFAFLRNLTAQRVPAPGAAIERTHEVGGRTLPLKVVENDRARRLTMRLEPWRAWYPHNRTAGHGHTRD